MTRDDYNAYVGEFLDFMESEGLQNLSTDYGEDETVEPHFSWHPCDVCRRSLGGDRYRCSGYNPTTEEVQSNYSVCVDCVYFAEYGRLDDQTMWEIEHSDSGPLRD